MPPVSAGSSRTRAGRSAVLREASEREGWNEAVTGLGGSVLQSWEWGEFRRHHGWEPVRLLDPEGKAAAQVLLRSLPGLGSLAYAPHGPVFGEGVESSDLAAEIATEAKKRGAYVLEIEPRVDESRGFEAGGFVKTTSVQPRCTLVVDILEDPEEQLRRLPKDTRYGVRRAGREGVTAGLSQDVAADLEEFLTLLEETAIRQKFALRPREYYREFVRELPAHLIVARKEGRLLAGAVILTFGEEAYYLYGASAKEGDNLYASYLTQFEAFAVAREAGARRYDMWGIPCEPREDHPLWGVYQFKKKFGGSEKRYAGAREKALSPLRAGIARTGIKGYYALQRLRGKSSGPIRD